MLALSFGVPVVIPRVGMTAEVLENSGAGLLYPGTDEAGLETALRHLLDEKDAGRLAPMGVRARALAERLDWPDFGAALGLPAASRTAAG